MGRAFEYRKATKFARWDKMAKQFSKASKHITIAVKQGGPDPDSNVLLRRAIQNAKAVQMPKDKIENAIKKGSDKDTSNYDEIAYEGMGPHGIAVVVETATDNPQRTVANVRSYFRKKGGSLGTQGMHDFLFSRKGVFYVPVENVEDIEELELEMIDYGLEEIEKDTVEEKEMFKLYTAFEDFGSLQEALERKNIKVEKSELERIPTITKELSEDQVDEVLALIDMMEQDDDVTNIFHNLA
ncbi:MAG: YebC/PmpR family DNA-binding transcriptional regulator [Saprospiraceae bacterium]|nr:YebC/PmpR family DNA-binding transcriptional regulator [Bacteroidia bacterium]NNF20952.1 YebC/PmpR family DNA-binding transcriptional regulator [Saprospiraceae bacterium]